MKIGIFCPPLSGGSMPFIQTQAVALRERGHEIALFCYRSKDGQPLPTDVQSSLQGRIHHPPRVTPWKAAQQRLWRAYSLFCSRNVKLMLANAAKTNSFGLSSEYITAPYWALLMAKYREKFDVIHAHFASYGAMAGILKHVGAIDVPVVLSFHGVDVTACSLSNSEALATYKWARRCTTLYTYNSAFIRDQAIQRGFPPDRMRHLKMGLSKIFMAPLPAQGARLSDKPVRIISVGRLVEKKGHIFAIRAARIMADQGLKFTYSIIGDGPLHDALASEISTLGLGTTVRLLGPMTPGAVRESLLESDIFLLPSVTASNGDMEGQGVVVQEAQACGLPVVVTRHNGVPEGMVENVTGLVCEEGNAEAMATSLVQLMLDLSRRLEMGRQARNFATTNYDPDRLAVGLEKIIQDAVDERLLTSAS